MQGSFGGETFTYSLFLVLCNRVTTMAVALVMLLVRTGWAAAATSATREAASALN